MLYLCNRLSGIFFFLIHNFTIICCNASNFGCFERVIWKCNLKASNTTFENIKSKKQIKFDSLLTLFEKILTFWSNYDWMHELRIRKHFLKCFLISCKKNKMKEILHFSGQKSLLMLLIKTLERASFGKRVRWCNTPSPLPFFWILFGFINSLLKMASN